MKQPIMFRVLLALLPVGVSAVYFFGWRVAAVWCVCTAAGLATEYLTARARNAPVSSACLVTCTLYGLSLPPTIPFWIAAVGVVVGILFGKEVFGGFGRNFVNPAILGRAFVYVSFPVDMTARFVPAFEGFPGGFARWSFASLDRLPAALRDAGQTVADAVSQASPMWVQREHGIAVTERAVDWHELLLGSIGGTWTAGDNTQILSAGSAGEGCALLIAAAGIYLLVTKTANWRLMLGAFTGVIVANLLLRNVMGFSGAGGVPPLYLNLLAGTTMYVGVFMITDPVSAPKKRPAMIAYGLLIGFMIVFLRWRGVFVAAATFSVLLGNLIGPWLDIAATAWADRRNKADTAEDGQ